MSATKKKHIGMWGLAAIIFIVLLFVPKFLDADRSYAVYFLFLVFIYITMAQAWNLIAGYTGQMSLGTQAFFGIGAYTAALGWKWGYLSFFSLQGMLCAGFMAAVLAVAIGIPLLTRLKGDYFTLGTLGLGEILRVLFINGKGVTGGAVGVMMPSSLYDGMAPYYYWALGLVTVALVAMWFLIKSRYGMAMQAVREDETAAASNGINVIGVKILAFAFGAFFIGIAGSLQAYYAFHISPYGMFSLNWGLMPILMVMIGGAGTFMGPIIGAVILAIVFEMASIWMPEIHPIFSGLMIILVTLFLPKGLLHYFGRESVAVRLIQSRRKTPPQKPPAAAPKPRPEKQPVTHHIKSKTLTTLFKEQQTDNMTTVPCTVEIKNLCS